jgi:hypothetical protein
MSGLSFGGGVGGGAGTSLRGDALLTTSGPPRKIQQKMCADMKVMSALLTHTLIH